MHKTNQNISSKKLSNSSMPITKSTLCHPKTTEHTNSTNKLYTFCSSEIKNRQLPTFSNDQNSLPCNSIGGDNSQYNHKPTNSKQRGQKNNISLILNRSIAKQKQRSNKNSADKITISIDLNHKNILQTEEQNKIEKAQQNTFNDNFLLQSQTLGVNKKIMIDESQLRRFTLKFAQQKLQQEQTIQKLQAQLKKIGATNGSRDIEKQDLLECLSFKEQENQSLKKKNKQLQSLIKEMQNQNQYLKIAKNEYKAQLEKKTIKIEDQEQKIDTLQSQIYQINEEFEERLKDYEQHKIEHERQIEMLQIEVEFLTQQIELQENAGCHCESNTFLKNSLSTVSQINDHEMERLKTANDILAQQLIQMCSFKAEKDALKQALHLSQAKVASLTAQLRFKQQKTIESFSESSHEDSAFQFKFGDQSQFYQTQTQRLSSNSIQNFIKPGHDRNELKKSSNQCLD